MMTLRNRANTERFIGVLSGTSMDSIDAVLVDFQNKQPVVVATLHYPFEAVLSQQLHQLIHTPMMSLKDLGELDTHLGQVFAKAVQLLLDKAQLNKADIRAIGSHGQTVFHHPHGAYPFSMQLGNPNVIAQITGIPTVANFRQKDLAYGGQGAPLAPKAHHILFRDNNEDRVIVNIGGIANITLLPKDPNTTVTGFDTGPGNCLMDMHAQKILNQPFDDKGAWAQTAHFDRELLKICLEDPYFKEKPPKSTGKEMFTYAWFEKKMNQRKRTLSPAIQQATLLALTSQSIAAAIQQYAPKEAKIYVCGGGAYNTALMQDLRFTLNRPIHTTGSLGIAPEWVEGVLFALLAKAKLDNEVSNLPAVTGASEEVVLGTLY